MTANVSRSDGDGTTTTPSMPWINQAIWAPSQIPDTAASLARIRRSRPTEARKPRYVSAKPTA
jgi:hypothetical protein